mgnify:CR=1 FL=1
MLCSFGNALEDPTAKTSRVLSLSNCSGGAASGYTDTEGIAAVTRTVVDGVVRASIGPETMLVSAPLRGHLVTLKSRCGETWVGKTAADEGLTKPGDNLRLVAAL